MKHRGYYAIIPADVRYNEHLPAMARLLYGEITALCNEKGFCWATNAYFAELYGVHGDTIRRWVTALVKEGFITVEIIPEQGNLRKIHLTATLPVNLRVPHRKNTGTLTAKSPAPIKDNSTLNNTSTLNLVAEASAPPKRGHRIPDDWQPSQKSILWAETRVPQLYEGKSFAESRLGVETEKFKNYWESATTNRAIKLDWDKAWKNWMLTANERAQGVKPNSQDAGESYLRKLQGDDKE